MNTVAEDTLIARCRQFATPSGQFDRSFADAVVITHAKALVELFVERHEAVLSSRTEGVLALFDRWLRTDPDFDSVWHPALGTVELALETGEPNVLEVASGLASQLSASGTPGAWLAELTRPVIHHWADLVLPAGRSVAVSSYDGEALIGLKGDELRQVRLRRDPHGRWSTEDVESPRRIPGWDTLRLVSHETVRDQLALEDEFHSIVAYLEPTHQLAVRYRDAMSILRQHAEPYQRWVSRVLRGIVPCRCDGTRTRSSSWREAPGIVLMSDSAKPQLIAEMLVHEACHQYFYLVRRLGPVCDQGDGRMYHSPAVSRRRPLDRIIMAYHAFANVLLFYRSALANSMKLDSAERVEGQLADDVSMMEATLLGNPSLTPLGAALVEPLAQRCQSR